MRPCCSSPPACCGGGPPIDDRRWCLLGLGAWVALQIAALAYGRAGSVWASRYFDIFTVGLLVNGACALVLWRMSARRAPQASRLSSGSPWR